MVGQDFLVFNRVCAKKFLVVGELDYVILDVLQMFFDSGNLFGSEVFGDPPNDSAAHSNDGCDGSNSFEMSVIVNKCLGDTLFGQH